VFFTSVSFQRPEKSLLSHQEITMPKGLPAPESMPSQSIIRLIEYVTITNPSTAESLK
jgi:acyl-CoA thioesterase